MLRNVLRTSTVLIAIVAGTLGPITIGACSRQIKHPGAPQPGEPFGRVTAERETLRLLAVGDTTIQREQAIIAIETRGFSVDLPPGRHALFVQVERRTRFGHRPGEPAMLPIGSPSWIVLDVHAGSSMRKCCLTGRRGPSWYAACAPLQRPTRQPTTGEALPPSLRRCASVETAPLAAHPTVTGDRLPAAAARARCRFPNARATFASSKRLCRHQRSRRSYTQAQSAPTPARRFQSSSPSR